jgi:hypothetical protein
VFTPTHVTEEDENTTIQLLDEDAGVAHENVMH